MSGSTCSPPLNRRHSIISSTMGSLSAAWRRKSQLFPISLNPSSRPSALMERYGVCDRRSIGTGATAVVKLCHKQDLVLSSETLFAIKYFRNKLHSETSRNYLKKITGEFCIGSSLIHPNIVSTIDLVQNETGNWCQVMEYCPGGDLFALVQHGKVDSNQATSFLRQLITAVKFLHENGVVHRDIKPENVLLASDGLIKVTDFGSSEVVRQPYKGVVFYPCYGPSGSNPYIAPESFDDKDFDGRKADVWSCAIVYIFMLTGQLPWKIGRSPSAPPTKFTSSISSDPNFGNFLNTSALPFDLPLVSDKKPLEFILKLLSIDPEHRPFADEIEDHPFLKD